MQTYINGEKNRCSVVVLYNYMKRIFKMVKSYRGTHFVDEGIQKKRIF